MEIQYNLKTVNISCTSEVFAIGITKLSVITGSILILWLPTFLLGELPYCTSQFWILKLLNPQQSSKQMTIRLHFAYSHT